MTNNIRPADINDFEAVRDITQTTIRAVYPNYYPEGAVEFFSAHHSDEKIREDIENLSCYPQYCRMLPGMLPVRARMIYNDFQGIRLSASAWAT